MSTLSWARNWLGFERNEEIPSVPRRLRCHYSPELVANLRADHAELMRQCAALERMAIAGRFGGVAPALAAFKARFDAHLLHENLHFYGYLEETLAADLEAQALIRDFRYEMTEISKGVVHFVRQFGIDGLRLNGAAFLAELRIVGAALRQRARREECDLYPLYQPRLAGA